MKIQDIIFIVFFLFLLWKHNTRVITFSGIGLLILAIPLFIKQIFFTAERFTWYAAAFFLAAAIIESIRLRKAYK